MNTTFFMSNVMARKGTDGRCRLFYRGTRNEVFPGMTWATAADARWHARVELHRAIKRMYEHERAAALAALRAAYAAQGLDADAEVDGIDTMTAEQLRDEVTYLSDYQG